MTALLLGPDCRAAILGRTHLEPTREFANERGDYVMIYRTGD